MWPAQQTRHGSSAHLDGVNEPHIAIVCADANERIAIARAFDAAPGAWRVAFHERKPERADVVVYGSSVADVADDARGVRFDPQRSDDLLGKVKRALGPRGRRCIVVTGAGGGTGATTVALHLARGMVAFGSCAFVDLDTRWGSADRLGMDASDARTWADVEADGSVLSAALPVAGGLRVLLAPRGGGGDPARVLDTAGTEFDRLIVDAPYGSSLDAALARSEAGVLVVPPAVPGARRAGALLATVEVDVAWAVVVNRTGRGGEMTRAELQKIIGCPIALELPCCPALRDAEDDGRFLTSSLHRWSRRVERLARALAAA